jgi:hypothetical protein
VRGKRFTRMITVAVVASGAIGVGASVAAATKPDPAHKVTICHATASKTNPYVVITVDIASIVGNSGHGNSGVNIGDIIPAFTMDGYTYAGHNLGGNNQAILDAGCDSTATTTTTTTGDSNLFS